MSIKQVTVRNIVFGNPDGFVLIAGPCVIENREMILRTAEHIASVTGKLGIPFVFKSSYRKANRTGLGSFKGIGDQEALAILQEVSEGMGLPVLTDIHTAEEAHTAAQVVDILQIPAFLCRQTELLTAAGETGKVVNIKKGQFLAPEDIAHAAAKVASTGNEKILLTERGTSFGYHNLVVDMRSLVIMRDAGYPVVMDATHSVQLPSKGEQSGGQPRFIEPLAMAAAAVGIDALFMEVHPNPEKALSDAASQYPLAELEGVLRRISAIDSAKRSSNRG